MWLTEHAFRAVAFPRGRQTHPCRSRPRYGDVNRMARKNMSGSATNPDRDPRSWKQADRPPGALQAVMQARQKALRDRVPCPAMSEPDRIVMKSKSPGSPRGHSPPRGRGHFAGSSGSAAHGGSRVPGKNSATCGRPKPNASGTFRIVQQSQILIPSSCQAGPLLDASGCVHDRDLVVREPNPASGPDDLPP
jgi:hypothetical protein